MAKLSEKIGYALGDAAAGGITWKVMSIAFPLFFTNVFGLTVADTATLMLIARMFDVVTDPVMGSLADRTQSRWGTYRPWLIFGAVPLGLIFALLLYTPPRPTESSTPRARKSQCDSSTTTSKTAMGTLATSIRAQRPRSQ